MKVFGKENLPKDQGCILCSSHASHMDTAIISIATGKNFTKTAMLAAKDYWFENPFRFFFSLLVLNLIPVERRVSKQKEFPFSKTVEESKKVLDKGYNILIYPEGTRTKNGEIGKFKEGAVNLAYHSESLILPVYVGGTFKAWPKGKKIIRPKKIKVFIGRAISIKKEMLRSKVDRLENDSAARKKFLKKVNEKLQKAVVDLKEKNEKK